jgi:ribose 5-phosphate isomerase A
MISREAQLESQKIQAASRAVQLVKPGMVVGLGTGTTARYFIDRLGAAVRDGLSIRAVATSVKTRDQAEANGIAVLEEPGDPIDLAVDGADEIDAAVNCIKGRGGALLREKIVAHASRRFVVIADESKLVARLGRGAVPIEVLPFLWRATSRAIESLGGRPQLRMGEGGPQRTDNNNLILDAKFGAVDGPLSAALHEIPGVLEHGLFIQIASGAIIGGNAGVRILGEIE